MGYKDLHFESSLSDFNAQQNWKHFKKFRFLSQRKEEPLGGRSKYGIDLHQTIPTLASSLERRA